MSSPQVPYYDPSIIDSFHPDAIVFGETDDIRTPNTNPAYYMTPRLTDPMSQSFFSPSTPIADELMEINSFDHTTKSHCIKMEPKDGMDYTVENILKSNQQQHSAIKMEANHIKMEPMEDFLPDVGSQLQEFYGQMTFPCPENHQFIAMSTDSFRDDRNLFIPTNSVIQSHRLVGSHQHHYQHQHHHSKSRLRKPLKKKLTDADLEKKRNDANKQERKRMHNLNQALESLREKIGPELYRLQAPRKLSKIKTLRSAITYIKYLKMLTDETEIIWDERIGIKVDKEILFSIKKRLSINGS